jgi:hypothetical protein
MRSPEVQTKCMQNESVILNDVKKNSKEAGLRSQEKQKSHRLNFTVFLTLDT